MSRIARLVTAACLLSLTTTAVSQLEFLNFPLNLTLPATSALDLSWHGQDTYVNITLAQFYYFGGGSEFRDSVTAFNNGSNISWTPDTSLQQGVYAFFTSSPNRNSSESPFFAITTSNSTPYPATSSAPATGGLSEVAKVGISIGTPLGFIILICLGFIFWRERDPVGLAFRQTSVIRQ